MMDGSDTSKIDLDYSVTYDNLSFDILLKQVDPSDHKGNKEKIYKQLKELLKWRLPREQMSFSQIRYSLKRNTENKNLYVVEKDCPYDIHQISQDLRIMFENVFTVKHGSIVKTFILEAPEFDPHYEKILEDAAFKELAKMIPSDEIDRASMKIDYIKTNENGPDEPKYGEWTDKYNN